MHFINRAFLLLQPSKTAPFAKQEKKAFREEIITSLIYYLAKIEIHKSLLILFKPCIYSVLQNCLACRKSFGTPFVIKGAKGEL